MNKQTELSEDNEFRKLLQPLGLEPSPGAELIHRVRSAAHLFDGLMQAKIRAGQLSPPRLRLLLCLFRHEHTGAESLNPTRLSRELKLSKNTISAHLRALEEMGLVEREVDPDDLRQFQIRLAQRGRECIARAMPAHMHYVDALVRHLEPREIAQLSTLLNKLIVSLRRHADECHAGECHTGECYAGECHAESCADELEGGEV